MNDTFYELAVIFFVYSFLAWMAETAVATFKEKDFTVDLFRDRFVLFMGLPECF